MLSKLFVVLCLQFAISLAIDTTPRYTRYADCVYEFYAPTKSNF